MDTLELERVLLRQLLQVHVDKLIGVASSQSNAGAVGAKLDDGGVLVGAEGAFEGIPVVDRGKVFIRRELLGVSLDLAEHIGPEDIHCAQVIQRVDVTL